jgi:hypothetical protein
VPGSYRSIFTLGNLGQSWYPRASSQSRSLDGTLQVLGSYTFSRAEDMDNYQLPEDSRNIDAEKARAGTDVTCNLMVGFTWQMPRARALLSGWSLSGIGVFRSNRPYTIAWGDDRNGDAERRGRMAAIPAGPTPTERRPRADATFLGRSS